MLLGYSSPLKLQSSCVWFKQVRFIASKSLNAVDFVPYQKVKMKLKTIDFIKRFEFTKIAVKQMLSKCIPIVQSLKIPPSKWPLNMFNNLAKVYLKPYVMNTGKSFLRTYSRFNGVLYKKQQFLNFPETRIIIQRTYSEENEQNKEPPGRHCYDQTIEKAMNHQILKEFNAGYTYLSMATYFGRTEIALPGAHGFFMRMHEEEHGHALKLISYQLMRGANVKLYPISIPACQEWESIEKALAVSVQMEKLVKESLLKLYKLAEECSDITTMHLMEDEFINEQDRSIWEMARLLKRVKCMGVSDTGEFLFDKELHKAFVKKAPKKAIEVDSSLSNLYL